MPSLSSVASTLRKDGYWCRLFLSIPSEMEVWRGTIGASGLTEPAKVLAVTTISGTTGDIKEDMEAEVFSAAGESRGRVRIAPGGYSGGTLQIEEVSRGRIQIIETDTIRVYRSWRLRPRLVSNTSTFDRDSRVAYSNQNATIKPVVVAGGGYVGFVSDGLSYVDVALDGSASYAADPDSGGSKTYLWDFQDGTIQSGSTTTATATVRFATGKHWISLTVTDSSNSAAEIQYIPILVHSRTGADAPIELESCDLTGAENAGWEASLTLMDEYSRSTLPDGSLVYVWAEEYYGPTRISYGTTQANRANIKFCGYLVSDNQRSEGDTGLKTGQYRALSPLAILQQLPGFSQVLEYATTPASWLEYEDLTVKGMCLFLVRWGTTLLRVHDYLVDITDYSYPAFYLQKQTPGAQIAELADAIDALMQGLRSGAVCLHRNPQTMDYVPRDALTTTFTLEAQDVFSLDFQTPHRLQVNQLEGRGFTSGIDASAVQPVFAMAPGLAPADAPQDTIVERLITSDTTDFMLRIGDRYALANGLYLNVLRPSEITLDVYAGFAVFDFYREWLALSLSSTYNARQLDMTDWRTRILRISERYPAEGAPEVSLTVQPESKGLDATLFTPDTGNDTPDDPIVIDPIGPDPIIGDPPPEIIPPPVGQPTYIWELGYTAGEVKRGAVNWTAGTVSWANIGTTRPTGTGIWGTSDPWNYKRKFVLTTTGLWKYEDVSSLSGSWTQVATNTALFGASNINGSYIEMSRNRRGWILIPSAAVTSINYTHEMAVSFDYGATWTNSNAIEHIFSPTGTEASGYDLYTIPAASPWNNPNSVGQGWVYSMAVEYATDTAYLIKSEDWGLTWFTETTFLVSGFVNQGCCLHVPPFKADGSENRNTSAQEILYTTGSNLEYWGGIRANGTTLWKESDGEIAATKRTWNTFNGRYVYAAAGGTGTYNILRSTSGGTNFNSTTNTDPAASPLKVGTEVSGKNYFLQVNGWSQEGTLINWAPGLTWDVDTSLPVSPSSVLVAYAALTPSVTDPVGFMRIKRSSDADWKYIDTGLTTQRVVYCEFDIYGAT